MSSGASTSETTSRAIAQARALFERARAKLAELPRPARVLAISTALAAVALFAYFGWKSTDVQWAVLYSNLDQDDAAAVVAKLKEMKTPYRVEGDGGTIEVPQAGVREVRLELAGAGLPRGGGVGFESFDKMRLGATEFEQRVLFRRSLEGELARTIDTLAAVQSVRVHLVLPERSVFVGRTDPASASVVLKLRPGRALGKSEVSGIVHLVASSVAGLAPERVAVVTTEGAVLHKPRAPGADGDLGDEEQASRARSVESTLEDRARAMLEKVVGAGHVDVRVTAELERARVERVEDRYDPARAVIRSEERSVERSQAEPTAAGVPGAESNLPGGARGGADAGADQGVLRESHTRNFEVDHVTEKRLVLSGGVRRLTVAVVVDEPGHGGARSKEELARLTALVRSAVGADESRGDVVTVDSAPFAIEEPPAEPPPAPSLVATVAKLPRWAQAAAGGGVGLVALVTLALGVRRRRRRAREAAAAAKALVVAEPRAVVDGPHEDEDADASELDGEELRAAALARAAEDPATAALVLRFWLGHGEVRPETKADAGIRVA